jgi:hypothetical protein
MATTYEIIDKAILTGNQSSVSFTGLGSYSSDYTDLVLKMSTYKDAASAPGLLLKFNGSSSSYSHRYLYGSGSSAGSDSNAYGIGSTAIYVGTVNASDLGANIFTSTEVYIPNFSSSNYKSLSSDSVSENNATTAYAVFSAGLWSNTAAITSIELTLTTGSFAQYSSFYLYGIKNS